MKEIVINQWTGLEDIIGWDYMETDEVRVTVKRDASFKLMAEGTFVAAVQAIKMRSRKLSIHFLLDLKNAIASPSDDSLWPDFLNSLGGLALIQIADKITDSSNRDITSDLVTAIWENRVIPARGMIGDGKKRSIVCRFPGNPVPRCLRQSSEVKVPQRLQFEELLRKLGKDLGATGMKSTDSFLDSLTEDELSGFLFESFRNVMEHNVDVPLGVWGVTVEKVVITEREDIRSRGQIPPLVYDYLDREIATRSGKKRGFLLSVTIADYGPGIQHTLPILPDADESGWERMKRAFEKGVSRKPKSGSPDWGQGLPNILDTVKQLKAILFVRSAEEAAIIDGGLDNREWIRVSERGAASAIVAGTSLSAIWIVRDDNPDQSTFDFVTHV